MVQVARIGGRRGGVIWAMPERNVFCYKRCCLTKVSPVKYWRSENATAEQSSKVPEISPLFQIQLGQILHLKKHAGKKINSWNLLSWSWTLFCSGMNQIAGPNVFWPNWAWPISEHKGSQKSSVVGSYHRHSLAIQVGVLTQNFPKPKSFKQKFSKRPDCLELVGNICVSDAEGVAPSQSSTFTAPPIHLWGESASISKNVENVRSIKCYFAVLERS